VDAKIYTKVFSHIMLLLSNSVQSLMVVSDCNLIFWAGPGPARPKEAGRGQREALACDTFHGS